MSWREYRPILRSLAFSANKTKKCGRLSAFSSAPPSTWLFGTQDRITGDSCWVRPTYLVNDLRPGHQLTPTQVPLSSRPSH
jgi:hypothetical protein